VTRTIRLDQAKLLKAIDENGNPLVEEPQPEQQQIIVHPNITIHPEIIIPPIEIPAIHVAPANVNVAAPDMQPVADVLAGMGDAINKSIESIPAPQIQVAATDMQPVADAINSMASAINSKPDHSESIKDLLQKIADRPTTAQWSFSITRDSHGNMANVQAVKL